MPDQDLVCCNCGQKFAFTARDQEFFAQKAFKPPRRCKVCRVKRKEGWDKNKAKAVQQQAQKGQGA